jgi:hypothetical protein
MIKKRAVEVWRVYQNLSAQHRVHALSCLLLHVGQHVGVGVHRLPYVGVPKHLLGPRGLTLFGAHGGEPNRRRRLVEKKPSGFIRNSSQRASLTRLGVNSPRRKVKRWLST